MPINRSIKTLEIKNFQSHAHTIINFDEGINIVQGTSNAGKSAINRAIVWALGNKPRGDFFIKKGTSCASVKITFYDNSQLFRVRSEVENFVIIKQPGGKGEKYEKFGGGEYPEEVKKFLSIPRENDALGLIFYAEQMSPLFLIDLSTADLPRAIGYLAGSDIMESASQSMISESRSMKRDLDSVLKEIKNNEKELKNFLDLDKKFTILKQIHQKLANIKKMEEQMLSLKIYSEKTQTGRNNIKKINADIDSLEERIELKNEVILIKNNIADYKKIKEYFVKYKNTKQNIDNIESRFKKSAIFFESYKPSDLKALKLHLSNYTQLLAIKNNSSKLIDNISTIKSAIEIIDEHNIVLTKNIDSMKKQLLEANYICRECGQKLQ